MSFQPALKIDASNAYLIDHIVVGAGFKASGGGGPISGARVIAQLIKDELINNGRSITWINPEDLPDDAMVCTMSSCGSPESITEHPENLNFNTWTNAWKEINSLVEGQYNKPLQFVMPVEIGAWSTLSAVIIGLMFDGITVVNGDGAGRAIPVYELSRISYVSCNPTVIANGEGDYDKAIKIGLFVEDVDVMQSLAQAVLQSNGFDNIGALSIWATEGERIKELIIPYTMTEYILPTAEVMIEAIQQPSPYTYMLENLPGAKLIVRGEVISKNTVTSNTLDLVNITVKGHDADEKEVLAVIYGQNENMYAYSSNLELPAIVGPDCVCWATTEQPSADPSSGSTIYSVQPLDNSNVEVNMEVICVGFLTNSITGGDKVMLARWAESIKALGYAGQQKSGLFAEDC